MHATAVLIPALRVSRGFSQLQAAGLCVGAGGACWGHSAVRLRPLSRARHGQVNAQTDGRTGAAGGRPAGFLTLGKRSGRALSDGT